MNILDAILIYFMQRENIIAVLNAYYFILPRARVNFLRGPAIFFHEGPDVFIVGAQMSFS